MSAKGLNYEQNRRWTSENKDRKEKYDANYYDSNKDKVLEKTKKYSKEHPEVQRLASKKSSLKFPEKVLARRILNKALQNCTISKPDRCETCGEKNSVHGHHEDYNKPLEVIWLCVNCHSSYHRKLRQQLNQKLEEIGRDNK